MSTEMFLELWQSAINYIQKKDRMDAAEHFIKIYDSNENLDDLKEIMGNDNYLDFWLSQHFQDDEELINEYDEEFFDE
tara:strand:+ start:297 stop:530 length:234 start_codon:yes stop_codon:yes gene_type:complete